MDCNNDGDDEWDDVIGGGDDDDEDSEDEPEQDSCTYHLCSDDSNLYELGWQNFGQAWNIWTNPNASYWQRYGAGAYMSYWGGAHLAAIGGTVVIIRQGVIYIGAQLLTSNPDAARVSLGNYPQYIKDGYTYFNAGKWSGRIFEATGLLKPMNIQFMKNQIAQLKPMDVTLVRKIGESTMMEMKMLQSSGLYSVATQILSDFTGFVHIFEPWSK